MFTTSYALRNGAVILDNGSTTSSVGNYTISGSTLSITLLSAKYLVSFALD